MAARVNRVLVIDDDEEDFLIIRDLLMDTGNSEYVLEWTSEVDAGRAALRARQHDAYLLDYRLGPADGMTMLREATLAGGPCPIIMLTGHGSDSVDQAALEAGASDFLVKGTITGEQLLRSLRYAIERNRQMNEVLSAHRRYRALFEKNPLPSWVQRVADGRLIAVNDAMVEKYGHTRDELLGMSSQALVADEQTLRLAEFFRRHSGAVGKAGVWRHQTRSGDQLWTEVTLHPLELEGQECQIAIANDITPLVDAHAHLALLDRAIQSSVNGVVICDARQPDQPIIFINAAFTQITGYQPEEVMGRNCRFLQDFEPDQPEAHVLRRGVAEKRACDVVLRNFRKGGELFWNHLQIAPVSDADGTVTHFVGVISDITKQRTVESELAYAASHDVTTGLPRFGLVAQSVKDLLLHPDASLALIVVDIDRLHSINEIFGHAAGDAALAAIARRLSDVDVLPPDAMVARLSGDKFAIVLEGDDPTALDRFVQIVRGAVSAPVEVGAHTLRMTASMGVARAPDHAEDPYKLLQAAESALYHAKRQGRGGLEHFTVEHETAFTSRLETGRRLHAALHRGELSLHFQPIVRAMDNAIIGAEALLRWTPPGGKEITASEFVAMAEATGLMPEIGEWTLRSVGRQLRNWLDQGLDCVPVTINIAASHFRENLLPDQLQQVLDEFRLPPSLVRVDVAEGTLLESTARTRQLLSRLRAMGVGVAMDDFGTGFSSLSSLKELPVDALKLDRVYFEELRSLSQGEVIARGLLALAREYSMEVIAEGVESGPQAEFLRAVGCDAMQGYWSGLPVPAIDFAGLLVSQQDKASMGAIG